MTSRQFLSSITLLISFNASGLELVCDGTGAYGSGSQTYSFKVNINENSNNASYSEMSAFLGPYIAKPWSLEKTDANYVLTLVQHVSEVDGKPVGLNLGLSNTGEGQIFQITISRVTGKFDLSSEQRFLVNGKIMKSTDYPPSGNGECSKSTDTK